MPAVILSVVVVAVAVAAVFTVVYALARRTAPATSGAAPWELQRTVEQPCGSSEHAPLPDPCVWQSATVSDLATAEDLLDRAETEGYAERELIVLDNNTFLVRWRGRAE